MSFPYAFVKVMKGEEPFLDKENRLPKEQAKYLLNGKMSGEYLGACLDSIRWGSQSTVMYEMNAGGMISFIRNWMRQNKGDFQNLFHEKNIGELYEKFELPFIDYEKCPRNETHNKVIKDLGNRMRCADKKELKIKPRFSGYFNGHDELAGMNRITYHDIIPQFQDYGEEIEDWERYDEEQGKFEDEEPIIVNELCYAILSDKGNVLSLETIINRLKLARSGYCRVYHSKDETLEFPFDGWDLAFYVQKWYEQMPNGKAPLYEKS